MDFQLTQVLDYCNAIRLDINLKHMILYYCFLPTCQDAANYITRNKTKIFIKYEQDPNSYFWKQYCLFLGGIPIPYGGYSKHSYFEQTIAIYRQTSPDRCFNYQTSSDKIDIRDLVKYQLFDHLNRRIIRYPEHDLIDIPICNQIVKFVDFSDKYIEEYRYLIDGALIGNHLNVIYYLVTQFADFRLNGLIYDRARIHWSYEVIEYFLSRNIFDAPRMYPTILFPVVNDQFYDLMVKYFISIGPRYSFLFHFHRQDHTAYYLLKFTHQFILHSSNTSENFIIRDIDSFEGIQYAISDTGKKELTKIIEKIFSYINTKDEELFEYVQMIFDSMFAPILKNSKQTEILFDRILRSDLIDISGSTKSFKGLCKLFSRHLSIESLDWNQYLYDFIFLTNLKHINRFLQLGVTQTIPVIIRTIMDYDPDLRDFYEDYYRIIDLLIEYSFEHACHEFREYLSMVENHMNELIEIDGSILVYFINRMICHSRHDIAFDDLFLEILENQSWSFTYNFHDDGLFNDCMKLLDIKYSNDSSYPQILRDIQKGRKNKS
jgi:hypothetical protein